MPTTRVAANALSGGTLVDTDPEVFLVVLTGDFTLLEHRGPPGSLPPSGHVLTFVVDRSTGAALDLGIGDVVPDIAQLGTVGPVI